MARVFFYQDFQNGKIFRIVFLCAQNKYVLSAVALRQASRQKRAGHARLTAMRLEGGITKQIPPNVHVVVQQLDKCNVTLTAMTYRRIYCFHRVYDKGQLLCPPLLYFSLCCRKEK